MQTISDVTDSYFSNAKDCIAEDGDVTVTYAFFVRVPSMFAPRLFLDWVKDYAETQKFDLEITSLYQEGDLVPAGEPLLYLTGSYFQLSECETISIAKAGCCLCGSSECLSYVCRTSPYLFYLHGSEALCGMGHAGYDGLCCKRREQGRKKEFGAEGFSGGASKATAHYFGKEKGMGTMPHALIGYYNSTLEAAKRFRELHSDKPFVVLNDYSGKEITDALEVCRYFEKEARAGELYFRLDTNGARYLEGLDYNSSIETIRKNAPEMLKIHLSSRELKSLYGQGVSAAAIWYFRNCLDESGFENVGIVASSGFDIMKCRVMKMAKAPIDIIGTGSYLPSYWSDTYATADIIKYGDNYRIKVGREYLGDRHKSSKLQVL